MKSKGQIQMDFRKASAEAERLECIADKLKAFSEKKMEESMRNLSYAWKGENSVFFLKKERQMQIDIAETAQELYRVVLDIRTTARQIYQAEMLAYEIADHRDSE